MANPVDLQTRVKKEIHPKLKKDLKVSNVMAVPALKKIVVNVGIGSYTKAQGNKDFSNIVENMAAITGQKPVVNKAKKAISNFKIRVGDPVGLSVTLRGKRMYDFLNKLINIVFPRVRDFRGLSRKAFDGSGNYSVGFREHIVFPEISPDDVIKLHGVQVNICTTAEDNEHAYKLLAAMGFPFKKEK
ncbi:50S ribosomal protein L5 [Candidatus Peregrinibacteria bacterium]|nr:50S ribosomal protein L5 [Candidatus Peregrinibacteria bacterium]